MSKKKQIRKLKKRLKKQEKILSKNCLTFTNSANENESITLSFIDGVFKIKKIIKSEQTGEVWDVNFK